MIIDTHAHYDDEQFDDDRKQLLAHLADEGIESVINVSASMDSFEKTMALIEQYPWMYAAVGIHPDSVGELNEETFVRIEKACDHKKVVAVGEIGLDYHWEVENRQRQQEWFIRQLTLAREKNLPFCIHSREAAEDTMTILKKHGKGMKGVIHCYSYSKEQAKEYIKMGYYIGVGGVVTFKNGKRLKETVREIPLNRILLETDCPYLAPEPFRGRRNSSLYLPYIAKEIANLKEISYDEVVETTRENAKNLFIMES